MEANPQLSQVTAMEFAAKYQSKTGRFPTTLSNPGLFYRGLPVSGFRRWRLSSSGSYSYYLASA